MTADLEHKIDLMKQEIDALQVAAMAPAKPWYRNVSTLLSVVAMLFSFSTTFVSYQRTWAQDIQSTRQELRSLLQRLAALPKEGVEVMKKYKDDPGAVKTVSSLLNQEGTLLVRQAAELTRKLPEELVSGTEYYAIAIAFQNSYDLAATDEFLKKSVRAAKDFNTEIAAIRSTANLQFLQGRPEAGRVEFQKALGIFAKYPEYDPFTKVSTNVWTELAWAGAEAGLGLPVIATQHVESAKVLAASIPGGPGAQMLHAQIAQAEAQFAAGRVPAAAVAGLALGAPVAAAR